MALVLSGERPSAAAASFNPVRLVVTWFAKTRADYAQQLALKSLLDLDAHRLEDLGINRSDLFDAAMAKRQPTKLLADRRSVRSGDHLNP